jgi:glucan biosynthesis protein C
MRRAYLDNIRFSIVWLVVIYHVIYLFNSAGVISNMTKVGIAQMDVLLYFVYPWFMCCLFLVSGMGARFSLEKRSGKQFMKERAKRLLLPAVAGIFILGWITGYITSLQIDLFGGNGKSIPSIAKYIIYSLIGIGPLWFAHELFLASAVLMLIRWLDKKDKLLQLGKRVNLVVLILLFFMVWGSSYLLNTPFIETYRNGIYIFMFLLGYYVFSHDEIIDILERWKIPLVAAAVICGIFYTKLYYGTNYTLSSCLTSPFTNAYLWLAILAILGCGKAWFNFTNQFTDYMTRISFGVYVLHYPVLVVISYVVVTYLNLPMIINYGLILLLEIPAVLAAYEIIRRIPILNTLLLGK